MKRALLVCCIGVLVPLSTIAAQSDRFGLGVSGIAGSFSGYDAVLPGVEGFIRVARGTFWSARLDGAYFGGFPQGYLHAVAGIRIA